MSIFLRLCEEYDPNNEGNDKFDLIDFLQSKGVSAALVKSRGKIGSVGDDTVCIDNRFYVTVSNAVEDGEDPVTDEVENEAEKGDQQASSLVKQRAPLAKQAQNVYKTGTTNLQKSIQTQQKRNQVSKAPTY